MKLVFLDRDGVVIVNRATNIRSAADIMLIDGALEGIAKLNAGGFTVAICTNQPEVARGAMTDDQLRSVHSALLSRLKRGGAVVDRVFSCTSACKCPRRKPAGGMLREALEYYGALPQQTPFVGDQVDDLKAAFHAGCRRILVRTGLGAKTRAAGIPDYLRPLSVHDSLLVAARSFLDGFDTSEGPPGR